MKTYQLRDPNDVYFVSVVLVIGTWKEYQNWVEKKFGVPPIKNNFYTGYHSIFYNKDNATVSTIWMPKYEHTISDMGILCHESAHSAMRILERTGVKIDGENHEAFTYLQEDIFTKALQALPLKKITRKKK